MTRTRLTLEEVRALPPGTTIRDGTYNDLFVVDTVGMIVGPGGEVLGANTFVNWQVVDEGHGVRHQETLAQFKQRLSSLSLSSGQEHSISMEPVRVALQRLNCETGRRDARPGDWVTRWDNTFQVPAGAGILAGDPAHWGTFGVFSRDWHPVLGGRTRARYGRIDGPDIPVGTPEDAATIAQFKAQVWDVGLRAKTSHSWCTAFERTMAGLDITAENVVDRAPTPPPPPAPGVGTHYGERANSDDVRNLPQGTLLLYREWGDGENVTVRDNDNPGAQTNPWRTRHLFGRNGGMWGGAHNIILFNPADGPMRIPVTSAAMLDVMPSGTQLRTRTNGLSTKADDGTWGLARHRPAREVMDRFAPVFIVDIPGMPAYQPVSAANPFIR